nr:hypothetical protein [uncultured Methanolobus sp.]
MSTFPSLMRCPDCRSTFLVYPGDQVGECYCGSTYDLVRDDNNIRLSRRPSDYTRPSSETSLDKFCEVSA